MGEAARARPGNGLWEPGSTSSHYRFHLEVSLRYHKSIKVAIEDGHANLLSDNLYSVAYWYQKDPHGKYPPLPAAEGRIPKFINTGGPGQDPKMK